MAQRKAIKEGDRVRYSYRVITRLKRGGKLKHRTGRFVRLVQHDSDYWKDGRAKQLAVVVFYLPKAREMEVSLLSLTKIEQPDGGAS